MIDLVLSEGLVRGGVAEHMGKFDSNSIANIFTTKSKVEKLLRTDLFLPIWHQKNNFHSRISMEEAYAFHRIFEMIIAGELFMVMFRLENWAYPDREEKLNILNVESGCPVKIDTKNKRCSDGAFKISRPIWMRQVLLNDEEEETLGESAEKIEVSKMAGFVEFGSQNILKTYHTLMWGHALLRVPYKINGCLHPVGVIIKNIDLDPISINPYVEP